MKRKRSDKKMAGKELGFLFIGLGIGYMDNDKVLYLVPIGLGIMFLAVDFFMENMFMIRKINARRTKKWTKET